ncbi:hypothetical protein [Streptomyces clavuligerus]|nr:hypothetical protein [Streptomyces clavuligerus]
MLIASVREPDVSTAAAPSQRSASAIGGVEAGPGVPAVVDGSGPT